MVYMYTYFSAVRVEPLVLDGWTSQSLNWKIKITNHTTTDCTQQPIAGATSAMLAQHQANSGSMFRDHRGQVHPMLV